jgi:hypothetical protein
MAAAIVFASAAFAQNGPAEFASGLRSKFGPPLLRETFVVRPSFEMVVDYAANGNVCRIQLPPIAPNSDARSFSTKVVDDFLAELIPPAMRGKEIGHMASVMGTVSVSVTNYENVSIAESANQSGRTGVTLNFPKEQCRDRSE